MPLFNENIRNVQHASELISQGSEAYQRDDFNTALMYFFKALELDPNSHDILHNIGQVYFTLEDYKKAILYFSKALEIKPNIQDTYLLRGMSYFNIGMYDDALADYSEISNHNPDAMNGIGTIYFRRGEFNKALQICQQAYRLNPNNDTIKNNLRLAKDLATKWEKLEKEEGTSDKFNSTGTSKVIEGAFDEALMFFKKALLIDPYNVRVYNNISEIYSRNKHYYEAIKVLNEALSINASNADTYHNLGIEYINLGELKKAVDNLQKALELNPRHHKALNTLGILYIKQKKYQEAIKCFEKSIEIKYDPRIEQNLNQARLDIKHDSIVDHNLERPKRGKKSMTIKYIFMSLDGTPAFTVQLPIDWQLSSSPGAYSAFKSVHSNLTLVVTHQRNLMIENVDHILSMAQEYTLRFLGTPIKTYGYCAYLGEHDKKKGKFWLPIDPILGEPYPIALEFGYQGQGYSGFKVIFLQPKEFEWTFTLNGYLTDRDVAELQDILTTLRPVTKNDLSSKSVIKLYPTYSQFWDKLRSKDAGCLTPILVLFLLIVGGLLPYVF